MNFRFLMNLLLKQSHSLNQENRQSSAENTNRLPSLMLWKSLFSLSFSSSVYSINRRCRIRYIRDLMSVNSTKNAKPTPPPFFNYLAKRQSLFHLLPQVITDKNFDQVSLQS